jgi:8-oxo-dGTP pyrophosphatase MutT (NUDIX family)
MADFDKVGLIATRGNDILLCRKDKLALLILPGGQIEDGETALECLIRELNEELGDITLENPKYLGIYIDQAASDPNKTVEIQLYMGEIVGNPIASSEIVELVWFGPESDKNELSPILINKIFPDLIRRGILTWREN